MGALPFFRRERHMREFTLKNKEPDFLKLNIGEESFEIPLATSMTMEEARCMETMDGAISFFNKYISSDIANALTLRNYRDIIVAWREASEAAQADGDATPGES